MPLSLIVNQITTYKPQPLNQEESGPSPRGFFDIAIGKYIYLTTEYGIDILELTNSSRIDRVGRLKLSPRPRFLELYKNILISTTDDGNIYVIHLLEDGKTLQLSETRKVADTLGGIFLKDNIVFSADGSNLYIFSILQ